MDGEEKKLLAKKLDEHLQNLDHVEEALKIEPQHSDLLQLKADLTELIRLVSQQMLSHEANADEKPKPSENPSEEYDNVSPGCTSSSSSASDDHAQGESAPDMVDYYQQRSEDKRVFNFLSKYGKRHDITDLNNQASLPDEVKNMISRLSASGKQSSVTGSGTSGSDDTPIPVVANRKEERVTQKSVMNYLNKQQKKIRRRKINEERVAQGLAPISFTKKKKP